MDTGIRITNYKIRRKGEPSVRCLLLLLDGGSCSCSRTATLLTYSYWWWLPMIWIGILKMPMPLLKNLQLVSFKRIFFLIFKVLSFFFKANMSYVDDLSVWGIMWGGFLLRAFLIFRSSQRLPSILFGIVVSPQTLSMVGWLFAMAWYEGLPIQFKLFVTFWEPLTLIILSVFLKNAPIFNYRTTLYHHPKSIDHTNAFRERCLRVLVVNYTGRI